ncbi:MAG: GTP-binding protein [Candidatus Lokiarchaeota archaeon]|nr:GTP-binding protein [Candidatus Lokiarchaeota archaeon]
MVYIADGRYELPEDLHYSKFQHVYFNKDKKLVGLDQLGFAFLKKPYELRILVEDEVKLREPFAVVSTEQGITTLYSPVEGTIKSTNENALKDMENDTYSSGYILKMDKIFEIDPSLITGNNVEDWGNHEVKTLLKGTYSFKVIEIGDSATGKTAIKVRFTDDYFKKNLKTTLGVDFGSKEMKCMYQSHDALFSGSYQFTAKINVWDAAGQAHFEKIRGMYYRGAKGAILTYDVNNPVSFENLDKWVEELELNVGKRIPVILVGNKIDLEKKVSTEKAKQYAEKKNFQFIECSAKTGENVDDIFKKIAVEIYKREENLD